MRLGIDALWAVLVLFVAAPMIVVGLDEMTTGQAVAPELQTVPVPDEWSRRKLETGWCSGSGGEFCALVVLSPPTPLNSRAEAETAYRTHLIDGGWARSLEVGERPSFRKGRPGQGIVLTVGLDFADVYRARTDDQPADPTDIVVMPEFQDEGEADRRSLARKLIAGAAAIIIAPGVILAVHQHRRKLRLRPPRHAAR